MNSQILTREIYTKPALGSPRERIQYRMNEEEAKVLKEASVEEARRSLPSFIDPYRADHMPGDFANLVWLRIANRVECDPNTIRPAATGDYRDFLARPLERTPEHILSGEHLLG